EHGALRQRPRRFRGGPLLRPSTAQRLPACEGRYLSREPGGGSGEPGAGSREVGGGRREAGTRSLLLLPATGSRLPAWFCFETWAERAENQRLAANSNPATRPSRRMASSATFRPSLS